jgi:hypothetical protein
MAVIVVAPGATSLKVKVTETLVASLKLVPPAFVALIRHVPAVFAVRVAVDALELNVQDPAVPPVSMA